MDIKPRLLPMIIRASHLTGIQMLVLHYYVLLKGIHDQRTGIKKHTWYREGFQSVSHYPNIQSIFGLKINIWRIVTLKNLWATKLQHSPRMRTVHRILGLLPRALPFFVLPRRIRSRCLGIWKAGQFSPTLWFWLHTTIASRLGIEGIVILTSYIPSNRTCRECSSESIRRPIAGDDHKAGTNTLNPLYGSIAPYSKLQVKRHEPRHNLSFSSPRVQNLWAQWSLKSHQRLLRWLNVHWRPRSIYCVSVRRFRFPSIGKD